MNYFRHFLASRRRVIVLAVICLALLAYVDWMTGPSVSVTCFYLIPVFFLSWYGGWRIGLLVALSHAIVWLKLDGRWQPDHTPAILAWNFAVRFVTFAAVVWLVHMCRNLTSEVGRLIADRTESLRREVELRSANEQAVRQLASQLSVAEDSERRRLGHELHDSLGQSLSVLKMRLEAMAAAGAPGVQPSLEILSSVIQQARTLTFELYPSMLDELGLATTLEHYARQLSSHVPTIIQVSHAGPAVDVPVSINSFLFRAAKELINNSLKHGKAKEIIVQIRRKRSQIRLVISDDGRGFFPVDPVGPGLGLPWIRERVRCFGGTVNIESGPNCGARIVLDLPLHAHASITSSEKEPHGEPVVG